MKLFDFGSRKKADPGGPAVTDPLPAQNERPTVTPEELVEFDNWAFRGTQTPTTNAYGHEDILAAAAIYQAQQVRRMADDIEAIRKHLTRLTLVESADRETP